MTIPRRTCEVVRALAGRTNPCAASADRPARPVRPASGHSDLERPWAAVIDADLQHDETQLPKLLALLQAQVDLSGRHRYIEGGSAASL